ncbi:MAG: hypothetical protein ACE14Q_07780, partial [Acidobacteriota bacterium]
VFGRADEVLQQADRKENFCVEVETSPRPLLRGEGGIFPPISGEDKGGVSLREDCFACQNFEDNLAVTAF